MLLKSQKNDIFDAIVSNGLSPSQFDVESINYKFVVKYLNSDYAFTFEPKRVLFSPGDEDPSESQSVSTWNEKIMFFVCWLDYLKREIGQPDKWAEFFEASKQVEWKLSDEKNRQFTYQEVQEIEASLNLIKSKIVTLGLLSEQLKLINSKMDYLCEKAKVLGTVDWKNLVIGTLIATILQLGLPSETSKALWVIFKEIFQKIISIDFPKQ